MTIIRQARLQAGGEVLLDATLRVPKRSRGLVLLARAATRGSPGAALGARVATVLERSGIATLRLDLLTSAEARAVRGTDACLDLELLADRLESVTHAILAEPDTRHLSVGYFGEGLGTPAALIAAARHARSIHAVVGCGGVSAVAREHVAHVLAPTLLVMSAAEAELARADTLAFLRGEKRVEILSTAWQRLADPGVAERVAELAAGWFVAHLAPAEHVREEDVGGWQS